MGCGASNAAASNAPVSHNAPQQRSNFRTEVIASRPLVATKPYRHGSPITTREITKQRADFWATRTEGNAQMWQAIRSAADALLENDVSLANAILVASSITTPNGSLEVCYDERGYQYKVPQYCVSNPSELSSSTPNENSVASNSNGVLPSLTASATVIPANEGVYKARAAAIATKSSNNSPINVRVRINPGDHNLTVKADNSNSIAELKSLIAAEAIEKALPIQVQAIEPDRQRVILMGRELQNNQKIADLAFDEAKVVQIFLRQQPKK